MSKILIDEAIVKLALEALENAEDQLAKPYSTGARYAITALREALAKQPAQQEQNRQIDQLIQERDHRDEIIDKLCDAVLGPDRYEWSSQYFFEDAVREVEERMAEQPAQQEPFGYFQYDIRLDAWVQNRIKNKGVAFYVKEQK